jgi:uncharacterized caspase-like protein
MRSIWARAAIFLVLGYFAVASATAAFAAPEKRIALVIGNSAYQAGGLPTAANDAGLIAQTLQAAGFDVVGARDLDQDSLRHAFRDFLDKVSASGPDTVAFVYLAGYGLQYEGDNYYVPVDAKIANATDVPVEAVRISDFTKSLAALQNKGAIIVLDSARATPFAQSSQPLAGGLALVEPDPNQLIAFNAAPGTIAPQEQGPYGAYAHALAEMMRVGGIPLADVFDRTRLRVGDLTKGTELPWNSSKFRAQFAFFDRGNDAPADQVSYYNNTRMRAKAIRDFDARDAYFAALDRDTLQGYEDFLAVYPADPMARRVRAIVAARREAITWRQTWIADTPEAYWSYLRRYPRGPHNWDARRRLGHFEAALEPPASFAMIEYDVPPPPEAEIIYVERPVLYLDDADFGFAPPPPAIFLPPPASDFVALSPPPPPLDVYVLPTPVFVPVPEWVRAPHDVASPENNVIFNNIHNTTINNVTTINQGATPATPGLTTGQKLTGAAVAAGAAAVAMHVALPPFVQKKAALIQKQTPAPAPKAATPGQTPAAQSQAPQPAAHALPGANGQPLPHVGGKPAVAAPTQTKTQQPPIIPNAALKGAPQPASPQAGHALPAGQNLPQTGGKPATAAGAHAKPITGQVPSNALANPIIHGGNTGPVVKGVPLPNAAAAKQKSIAPAPPGQLSNTPAKPAPNKSVAAPPTNKPAAIAKSLPQVARQPNPAAHIAAPNKAPPAKPQAQPKPVQQQKKPPPAPEKPDLKKKCGLPGLPACPK